MNWAPLADSVAAWSRQVDVSIAVSLQSGPRWLHQATHLVPAASTAKIPIMVETFRRIERKETALEALCTVCDPHAAKGSGVLRFLHDGLELTVRDLLYLMIAISDNVATNMLIDAAGYDAINKTMHDLGMRDSVLGRPMVRRLAQPLEQENLATAQDYLALLEAIVEGRAASASSCGAMLELLMGQQNNRRIGRVVFR